MDFPCVVSADVEGFEDGGDGVRQLFPGGAALGCLVVDRDLLLRRLLHVMFDHEVVAVAEFDVVPFFEDEAVHAADVDLPIAEHADNGSMRIEPGRVEDVAKGLAGLS